MNTTRCVYCGHPLDERHSQTREVKGHELNVTCTVKPRGYVDQLTMTVRFDHVEDKR